MSANETQVGGTHYKSALEHWDWSARLGLPAMEHQISRYLSRYHKKAGLEDLKKALHHAQKLKELVDVGTLPMHFKGNSQMVQRTWVRDVVTHTAEFVSANNCALQVQDILLALVLRSEPGDLSVVCARIQDIIDITPEQPKPVPVDPLRDLRSYVCDQLAGLTDSQASEISREFGQPVEALPYELTEELPAVLVAVGLLRGAGRKALMDLSGDYAQSILTPGSTPTAAYVSQD